MLWKNAIKKKTWQGFFVIILARLFYFLWYDACVCFEKMQLKRRHDKTFLWYSWHASFIFCSIIRSKELVSRLIISLITIRNYYFFFYFLWVFLCVFVFHLFPHSSALPNKSVCNIYHLYFLFYMHYQVLLFPNNSKNNLV